MFAIFSILFAFYVYSEKNIDKAYEQQHLSMLLSQELHHTTESLSTMAHMYVVTRDPVHKGHYNAILNIRNGTMPRPDRYGLFYWDLIENRTFKPDPSARKSLPLLERMRLARFSEKEFAILAEAMKQADALARIEREAMRLADTDPKHAAHMLHAASYDRTKSAVMRPISELYVLMDRRTAEAIEKAQTVSTLLRTAFILFGIWLFWAFWRGYHSLRSILGTSPVHLHSIISGVGKEGFSSPLVAEAPENSILSWVIEMHERLEDAHKGQKRMTMLYRTLSECNKAIVHSSHEQELFDTLCRIAVEEGEMKMAWIGIADGETRRISPVAWHGEGTDYLDDLRISTDPADPTSVGPTGKAFQEGKAFWVEHFDSDSMTSPWQQKGAQYGWKSSAALPLKQNGETIGVFSIYSVESDAFDLLSKKLVEEIVGDINFALDNFERERGRKDTQKALSESYALLKTIINTVPMRIFWKDENLSYLGSNLAFARDAGENDPDSLVGKDDYQLCWKEEAELYRSDDRSVIESGQPKLFIEEPQTTPEGETIWLSTSKVPLKDEKGDTIGILGVYEDITERKRSEERIQYLANYDSLTALPNRTKLYDRMAYTLTLAKRHNEPFALLFLDLDHFKDINDSLGHTIGDRVLIELAKRLQSILREEDTVARLGGDEFIIILPNTDSDGADQVSRKLLAGIMRPLVIDQYELTLTACLGIALYPQNGLNIDDLNKNADTALHRAKREGSNNYCFFAEEMQERSIHNLKLSHALHSALALDQLELYYQPQIDAKNGHIIGAEALIRWNHPEFGIVSPSEFIPIAEESGLILPIGEWVLRSAVSQAKGWMNAGMPPLIMAVNLSAIQFRHNELPELVTQVLAENGLAPEYLEIELTESVTMNDPQKAIRVMNNLHKRGVRMSIDDFGTGYSSLNYLKQFKIYKLKIDQSFIRDINIDSEDRTIVSAVISMSKHLGLRTIAEGVETIGQIAYLREEGCDELQGYYFSTPLRAVEFDAFRKGWEPRKMLSAD